MNLPESGRSSPAAATPGAGYALALLLSINLFNYIDRQVLSAVLPKLEMDPVLFDPADPLLKLKLGSLTTAFLLAYMVTAPIFGRLGDRRSRWVLVGIGVIVWSLASGGSGWAVGFAMLLITRCLVGIGEAAYGPVAPAMLSDLYPEKKRGRILAVFFLAIPVGSALGFVIGGQVAETSWGWRGAFEVVVIPGLVLGAICFFMKEPRRSADHDVSTNAVAPDWSATCRELIRIRSFRFCSLGMTCSTFVLGGVAAWAPYYIYDREARFEISHRSVDLLEGLRMADRVVDGVVKPGKSIVDPAVIAKLRGLVRPEVMTADELRHLLKAELRNDAFQQYQSYIWDQCREPSSPSLGRINLIFGAIVVVGGFTSTVFGGWLGDRLRGRVRGAYLALCGLGALLSIPTFIAFLCVPFPLAWIFMFLTVFGLFVNTGPANTVLANVTRSPIRASAFAINILVIHLFGDAISPPLMGLVGGLFNMQTAMWALTPFIAGAGILWWMGARTLDPDTAEVTAMEQAPKEVSENPVPPNPGQS